MGIIVFAIFYLRRQKKYKNQQVVELAYDNENLHDPIHVDWDQIDNEYKEIEAANSSPHSTNPDGATKVNSPELLNNYVKSSNLNQYTPNLADTNILNDNARNIPVKPSIATQDGYSTVKPDGS